MSGAAARVHYLRVLAQFARLVKGRRKRCGISLDELSKLSDISVPRLMKYEDGFAPPHWADALMLAQALGVRLSVIITALKRPLHDLRADDYKRLIAFVQENQTQQREELRADIVKGRLIHLEEAFDPHIHDATIADWPEFLPPFLGDALMAQASRLYAIFQVLDIAADCGGDPVPIGEVAEGPKAMDAGVLLSHVHAKMGVVHAQLDCLRVRHTVTAPTGFAEYVEVQRFHMSKAMQLIMPYRRDTPGSPLTSVGARDDGKQFSNNLSQSIDRVLIVSYGLTDLAHGLSRDCVEGTFRPAPAQAHAH